jgi:Probable Zinc-ribbon domain
LNRAIHGSGCPTCAGKVVTSKSSLQALFPAIAAEWHPTKNGDLTPQEVAPKSSKPRWWSCAACGHEWLAQVSHRSARGDGCPACSGRAVTKKTSLAARHRHLSTEWHPIKNGELTPAEVAPGTGRRVWWQCARDASHVWQATVASRACNGAGCPMCAGRMATPTTSLVALYPDTAAEWHPTKNGDLRPETLTAGAHRIAWWRCSVDSTHEWRARVGHRAKDNSGCPMCANLVPTPTSCLRARCPTLAHEWHPKKNGSLTPDDVVPGSSRNAWWRCALNPHHVWVARICERAGKGRGCPACRGAYSQKKRRSPKLRGPTMT